jgi:hypothetical protein
MDVMQYDIRIGSVEWSAQKVRESKRLWAAIMEIFDPPMRNIDRWEDDGGRPAQ